MNEQCKKTVNVENFHNKSVPVIMESHDKLWKIIKSMQDEHGLTDLQIYDCFIYHIIAEAIAGGNDIEAFKIFIEQNWCRILNVFIEINGEIKESISE